MIQRIYSKVEGQGPSAPSFIDLFCGCGGFTLGMLRAGLQCAAAIDFDSEAVSTLQANLPSLPYVLQRDLTKYKPADLAELIGRDRIDVIVGGPPCQGFSTARKVDGTNHGARLTDDPRRHLYREFLKYVDFFQPSVFVIENVLGMRQAADGEYFTRVQHEARTLGRKHGRTGYRVHAQIEDAAALGVPQKRRRQLIVGVRADLPGYFIPELAPAPSAIAPTTLGDAIGDLPVLRAGGGQNESEYDLARRANHLTSETARNYLFKVLEIERATNLTNHVARPHSDRDLRDFARLREGETSAVAMRERGVKFEFPYDKSSFKDRYTRQSRKGQCSTIVAHLSKDGLMFIHPTQNRSITPREAARIQSFPDWFRFPEARTHSFRLIGNAVPPLVAESVGTAIAQFLREMPERSAKALQHAAPKRNALVTKLSHLASLKRNNLRALKKQEFLEGWQALLILFPDLHPVNALDHGDRQSPSPELAVFFPELQSQARRRYLRSGWPVAFEVFGREAWRRRNDGELSMDEFYRWMGGHGGPAERASTS